MNLRDFGNILQARNIERKSYLGARINAFTAFTIFINFYIFSFYNNDYEDGNSSDGVTRAAQRWTFDKCSSLSQSVFFVMLTLGPVFQVGTNLKKKGKHGGKKGKKIWAGAPPPPFSGNAQKKTFFFSGGHP